MSPYTAPGIRKDRRPKIETRDLIEYFKERSAEAFGVKVSDLSRKIRQRKIVEARQVAMYLIKKNSKHTLKEIGAAFGGRDHTTVIHSCETVKDLMDTQDDMRHSIEEIQGVFNNEEPLVRTFAA